LSDRTRCLHNIGSENFVVFIKVHNLIMATRYTLCCSSRFTFAAANNDSAMATKLRHRQVGCPHPPLAPPFWSSPSPSDGLDSTRTTPNASSCARAWAAEEAGGAGKRPLQRPRLFRASAVNRTDCRPPIPPPHLAQPPPRLAPGRSGACRHASTSPPGSGWRRKSLAFVRSKATYHRRWAAI
jgi:hypothetical protein